MDEPPPESQPPFAGSQAPFRKAWRRRRAQLDEALDVRARFWDLLNLLEDNRALRIRLYAAGVVLVLLGIAGVWYYPQWREDNAIQMARQWLAAGKLDRAGEAVQVAIATAPNRAETWALARDHARQVGLRRPALAFARQASQLDEGDVPAALDWASTALAAGDVDDAKAALERIDRLGAGALPLVSRFRGELARQQGDLPAARGHFEAAWRLEPGQAVNEVPLGIVLLALGSAPEVERARTLLRKWEGDPAWGADALRELLAQAVRTTDRAEMVRLAEALRAHPARGPADALNSLLALGVADEVRLAAALAEEQRRAADDGVAASELIAWLGRTGRGAEAWRWAQTLRPEIATQSPVALSVADALRLAKNWTALKAWTQSGDWRDVDFLRRAHSALAARELGEAARANALWEGLRDESRINGGRGYFLAGVLYSWGWQTEAVELWQITSQQGGLAINSFGALARHYQVKRDAEGQFRAFRGLFGLRVNDPDIANNYAYLAALTGNDNMRAEQAARANHERHPENLAYRATYAFVLHRLGRTPQALALLEPVGAEVARAPALATTYGLILAAAGRRAEANRILGGVDRTTLTAHEAALVTAAVGN